MATDRARILAWMQAEESSSRQAARCGEAHPNYRLLADHFAAAIALIEGDAAMLAKIDAEATEHAATVSRLTKDLDAQQRRAEVLLQERDEARRLHAEWDRLLTTQTEALRAAEGEIAEIDNAIGTKVAEATRADCYRSATEALRAAYVQRDAALKERDEARAQAERARASESDLRAEIGVAFRRHGMAAGPEAVDALVRDRDAARKERDEARAGRSLDSVVLVTSDDNPDGEMLTIREILERTQEVITERDAARKERDEARAQRDAAANVLVAGGVAIEATALRETIARADRAEAALREATAHRFWASR